MTTSEVIVRKYTADEGMVFDWAESRYHDEPKDPEKPDGEQIEVRDHLYAKTIFLAANDSIENYIEIEATANESNK